MALDIFKRRNVIMAKAKISALVWLISKILKLIRKRLNEKKG